MAAGLDTLSGPKSNECKVLSVARQQAESPYALRDTVSKKKRENIKQVKGESEHISFHAI